MLISEMNETMTMYREAKEIRQKVVNEVIELLKTKELPICEAELVLEEAKVLLRKIAIVK